MTKLAEILQKYAAQGELFETLDENQVRCFACANRCVVQDGEAGICRVRFNQGGKLNVPFGYVSGAQCDPVEKKPFFHVRPGSLAYSFGMLGCNLHCGYCQNWVTSQALRESILVSPPFQTTPDELVQIACSQGAETGQKSGLRFVYAGNLPGRVGNSENTCCPRCRDLLVERYGYRILKYNLTAEGCCPSCNLAIPGRWSAPSRYSIR